MSKTTKRNIIVIIVAVLVAVFISTLIGSLSNGYEDLFEPSKWNKGDINTENFISKEHYLIKTTSFEEGIEVVVDSDGLIKVNGENKSDSTFTADICTITLPAGTYTFTSGVAGTSASKYYLKAGDYYADFNNNTFELEEETELTVVLNVLKGETINTIFAPVIVEGEEEGSFYLD